MKYDVHHPFSKKRGKFCGLDFLCYFCILGLSRTYTKSQKFKIPSYLGSNERDQEVEGPTSNGFQPAQPNNILDQRDHLFDESVFNKHNNRNSTSKLKVISCLNHRQDYQQIELKFNKIY